LQAAQAAHAAFEFSKEHRLITSGWMAESNFIVLVTVPDEQALSELVTAATMRGLRTTINFEPDVNNEPTAVVVEPCPESRRLCSSLPLLGREAAMA
jgi:DNA-binding Lrp family transcriptional regulator